mmetsp:Transcript_13208/g.27089  ORF Transcript_13208/g.27089 Transcript_13208/m.27089 type:complete len:187 (+) Transcript_13208:131-691(+)
MEEFPPSTPPLPPAPDSLNSDSSTDNPQSPNCTGRHGVGWSSDPRHISRLRRSRIFTGCVEWTLADKWPRQRGEFREKEVTDLQHRLIGLGHLSSSAVLGTWTAEIPSALETMLDRLGYISHSETLSLHGLEARQVQVGKFMFHKGLVVALQRFLKDQGMDCDDIEGVFGANTAEALIEWTASSEN